MSEKQSFFKREPALTLYLATNLAFILVFIFGLFWANLTMDTYRCDVSLGSNQTKPCSFGELAFEVTFFSTWLIIILQAGLVPGLAAARYGLRWLEKEFSSIKKKPLWVKYIIAFAIYALVALLVLDNTSV